jgi:DNA-binding IclR family transcriptional regulator
MKEKNENSMQKIFSIIEYMSTMKRKVTIQEMAAALNYSTATVYRILSGLKELGYAAQHSNKQYYLTYKLYEISGNVINRDEFVEKMIPFMNYFAVRFCCEIGLTVFNDMSIVHIISVGENVGFGSLCPLPGQSFPAYCTAAGKVFLAQMDEDKLRERIAQSLLIPRTRNTIIDRDKLYEEIRQTKERGYGVVVGELFDLIACIAFPIRDSGDTVVGTLNFSTRVESFLEMMNKKFVEEVKETMRNFGL